MNDKEKLISLLILTDPNPYTCESESGSCELTTCTECRARSTADLLISHGVTVQEWISVKDRLPENGVHVLLCCEMHRYGGEIAGKYICDGYYAEANKIIAGGFPDDCDCEYSEEDDEYYLCEGWYEVIKNWDDYNSVTVEDSVTHWMPLPRPPKGE